MVKWLEWDDYKVQTVMGLNPSSKWVPFLNQGRVRERKGRNELYAFHFVLLKTQSAANPSYLLSQWNVGNFNPK